MRSSFQGIIYFVKVDMKDMYNSLFFVYSSSLPRLAAVDGLLLFSVKKNQKTLAENFSLEARRL
ncbi:hypothetical protein CA265_14770 [Sphingobacteriaceae bacterium GW460-11-11-14-LB5]|nr:hypothetical protein CA265_14770 [Sphingobacteriaceae bacterium GW460-11-11-14-LB5]